MKTRKHKSDKVYLITFQTRYRAGRKERLTPKQTVPVVSISVGSARRGFLFGRDKNNTVIYSIACEA